MTILPLSLSADAHLYLVIFAHSLMIATRLRHARLYRIDFDSEASQ